MKKMENLVEDNGICDCHYLLTMRLALQREVDSPFGINSIYMTWVIGALRGGASP